MKIVMKSRILPLLVLLFTSHGASALDTSRSDVSLFIDSMVNEHDYDRATLEAVLLLRLRAPTEFLSLAITRMSLPMLMTMPFLLSISLLLPTLSRSAML